MDREKEVNIYSIGHGNKSVDQLVEELNWFNIRYVIDVRSKPYSRYNPQFNKEALEHSMKANGFHYIFMGHQIGGIPEDDAVYTNDKVDYNKLKDTDYFKIGLSRVIQAHEKGYKAVLMCGETQPQHCHRTKLIGKELSKNNIPLLHIMKNRKVKDQATALLEATKGLGDVDLFSSD
jgi:uncharacterized protein (DUF488 family)